MTQTTASTAEFVFKGVARIWAPGVAAMRVQKELNVRSFGETSTALQRAGYELYRADLPMAVSGAAAVVDGKRYIVVNRYESRQRQQYTASHELGHHVLHLDPSRPLEKLGLDDDLDPEFEADLFASVWAMHSTTPQEREEVLRRNPQARMVLSMSVIMTVFIVVAAVVLYGCSRLFSRKAVAKNENR